MLLAMNGTPNKESISAARRRRHVIEDEVIAGQKWKGGTTIHRHDVDVAALG